MFDADGIRVFVNANVMAEVKAGVLRFNFGPVGWSEISLEPTTGEGGGVGPG